MPEPYAIYGPFYDATQGTPSGAQYLHLLRKHHPAAKTVLELACGTGAHLATLGQHYEVEGLDRSRTMLRFARKRLPGVRFTEQSMAGFELDARFDAIVCPYDSINHLLRLGEWKDTFRAAKRHLNAGGLFVFDVNTERRLQELAAEPPWVHRFDDNYLIMDVSLVRPGLSSWDIKVFEHRKGDRYRLHHAVIRERAFTQERIRLALGASFGDVRVYDERGWSRPRKSSRRLFYVCR